MATNEQRPTDMSETAESQATQPTRRVPLSKKSKLAKALHDSLCVGFNAPVPYCDGTGHLKVFGQTARAVLGNDDPRAALHARLCALELHGQPCPQRQEHTDYLATRFEITES